MTSTARQSPPTRVPVAEAEADYASLWKLIDRLHRQHLDRVSAQLVRLGAHDINHTQTIMLGNIGKKELTVGQLTMEGWYLGSNVSYNVKKLIKNGYLTQRQGSIDRRLSIIRLSEKGLQLRQKLEEAERGYIGSLLERTGAMKSLPEILELLERIEKAHASLLG